MLKKKKSALDVTLKNAFNSGYANATSSLRKMVKDKIYFNNFHAGFYNVSEEPLVMEEMFGRIGSSLLLTTEIFGDISGKSYLLISDAEFQLLTREIPEMSGSPVNLKEEFAKELDNILSASVITSLSNELHLKLYGDIPVLVGRIYASIQDLIFEDFASQTSEVYVTAIRFSFDDSPAISPLFVWVVNSETLRLSGEHSLM